MNYPTPYGEADELALRNEQLIQTLRATRATLDVYKTSLEAVKDLLERGELSDDYHTFNELYEARMLYHAHAVSAWEVAGVPVLKSWRHHDGELCFGGGWFIVITELPTGQISQHYKAEHWDLFDCPEIDIPTTPFDGHTTKDVHQRLRDALEIEES